MERSTRPNIELKGDEQDQIEQIRDECDQVLEEISRRVKSGQVPTDGSVIGDDQLLVDLEDESNNLLDKENQRHKFVQESGDIEAQVFRDRITADE